MTDTAQEKVERRAPLEREHGDLRAAREAQYVQDKRELEATYLNDLRNLDRDRRQARVAAGLNPDGTDPQGRQQGQVE